MSIIPGEVLSLIRPYKPVLIGSASFAQLEIAGEERTAIEMEVIKR